MKSDKIFQIFLFFFLFVSSFLTGCMQSYAIKSYSDYEKKLDSNPMLGLLYLDKITINRGYLSIKQADKGFPSIKINGEIAYKKSITLSGVFTIGLKDTMVFDLNYDFIENKGIFKNIFENKLYNISPQHLNLSNNMMDYVENSICYLFLFLKGEEMQVIRDNFYAGDIIFNVRDGFITESHLENTIFPIVVKYGSFKKWGNIYYPSTIKCTFKNYNIDVLIVEAEFQLSF
ncbi:MAG TPA: hypothetical protein PKH20_01690 [Exilispira sp.]|nr:hypothetical protein [Exilispira sp.]